MHSPTSSPSEAGSRAGHRQDVSTPSSWRILDEHVTLTLLATGGTVRPHTLRWRGSTWSVVGTAHHWSTWHALAVEQGDQDVPPTSRALRVEFWRFSAQTNPVAPVFHFEIRGREDHWRLARLGVVFDLPVDA